MTRLIYRFGAAAADGDRSMRTILGGKGANLVEMAGIGLPVPPGFTISTDVWKAWSDGADLPDQAKRELCAALHWLEEATERSFGGSDPLLVSVRSGSPVSMPGMMDTILNLGLNDQTVVAMAERFGDERFAYDCYRRLIQMFGEVVFDIDAKLLSEPMTRERIEQRTPDLDASALKRVVRHLQAVILAESGNAFPQDPLEQLDLALEAVFASWNSDRANAYRKEHGIAYDIGTAANVQAMVFGNRSDDSGTMVIFTRDTASGENILTGEFLINAQGEDVVAGTRTPRPIHELSEIQPDVAEELTRIARLLEAHYGWPQDIEATFEDGELFFLQTRDAKLAIRAAVRIAADVVEEGLCTQEEALLRLDASKLYQLYHPQVDPTFTGKPIAQGIAASPGVAIGEVVFTSARAVERALEGATVLLVAEETTPRDFEGMMASVGILTALGGMASHAAVVARGAGRPAIVGTPKLHITDSGATLAGRKIAEGDVLSIDGSSGDVYWGVVPVVEPIQDAALDIVLSWADRVRTIQVLGNADTPEEAEAALAYGAEGIGLCRTEHMFRTGERLEAFQDMILAPNAEAREEALRTLLPMQRDDFIEILRTMDGKPVTIRLLDPPLREFLPEAESIDEQIRAASTNDERERLIRMRTRLDELTEVNPMLGTRGARLLMLYPEIVKMQTRAVSEATSTLLAEGFNPRPEIMVPMVFDARELAVVRSHVQETIAQVRREFADDPQSAFGSMIEIAGACFVADEIVEAGASFISFGTNDLTQFGLGLSRDDTVLLVERYIKEGVFKKDPWQTIDAKRIGEMMRIAVQKGREADPHLKIGICGEHGGDPESIELCVALGLNYVSASPSRLPTARLAAAQAALRTDEE